MADPGALISFIVCLFIALIMTMASKSTSIPSSSKSKKDKVKLERFEDKNLLNFKINDEVFSTYGYMKIVNNQDQYINLGKVKKTSFIYTLPNNYHINGNSYNFFEYRLVYKNLGEDFKKDIYYNTYNLKYLARLPKYFDKNTLVPLNFEDSQKISVYLVQLLSQFTNIKNNNFKDLLHKIYSFSSVKAVSAFNNQYELPGDNAIRGNFDINCWGNPLNVYNGLFFSFFHKTDSIYFKLFWLYVQKYSIKVLKLNNLSGDKISENYVAIFDKEPDFSFYLLNFSNYNGDPFISYGATKNTNIHKNLFLSKYPNFQDISGFAYKGISLKKTMYIEPNILNIFPNGLFPNEIMFKRYNNEFDKLRVQVSNKLDKVNLNEAIFYSLLDISNPYFNKTMLPFQKEIKSNFDELIMLGKEAKVLDVRWQNEFQLYLLFKKEFPQTIFQYRNSWLGNQSIDIFIPNKKVAIEYQGEQHYNPIDFFGGEKALVENRRRDSKKKRLCLENGVKLYYWSYKKVINKDEFDDFIQEIII